MSRFYWLRNIRAADERYPSTKARLLALEHNQEIIMDEIAELQANEANLESAVSDAIDDIHSLNAQLQAAVAGNNLEGVRSVASAMAASTARLREALPTKANPAPQPAPEVDERAAQAAKDQADLAATNDTTGGNENEPVSVPAKAASPAVAANMQTTGSDAETAAIQMQADLQANAATNNGLSVAMQHGQASAAELDAAKAAAAAKPDDSTESLGDKVNPDAPSLAETFNAATEGQGDTVRDLTSPANQPMVNGQPVDPDAPPADPNDHGPAAPAADVGIDPNAPSPLQAAPGVAGDAAHEGVSQDSVDDVAKGTAHDGTDTASADAAAQVAAQNDAGSVAGTGGGPAPTPQTLGEASAENDPAKGTVKDGE